MSDLIKKASLAKATTTSLATSTTKEKNEALELLSKALRDKKEFIIAENQKDIERGRANGLHESLIDRLVLNEKRIKDMADALLQLVELDDPIGNVLESWKRPNDLEIEKYGFQLEWSG